MPKGGGKAGSDARGLTGSGSLLHQVGRRSTLFFGNRSLYSPLRLGELTCGRQIDLIVLSISASQIYACPELRSIYERPKSISLNVNDVFSNRRDNSRIVVSGRYGCLLSWLARTESYSQDGNPEALL